MNLSGRISPLLVAWFYSFRYKKKHCGAIFFFLASLSNRFVLNILTDGLDMIFMAYTY